MHKLAKFIKNHNKPCATDKETQTQKWGWPENPGLGDTWWAVTLQSAGGEDGLISEYQLFKRGKQISDLQTKSKSQQKETQM